MMTPSPQSLGRKASPSKRQDPPMQFISIVTDDHRDDDEGPPHDNALIQHMQARDHRAVAARLQSSEGLVEAGRRHGQQYALHVLCQCGGSDAYNNNNKDDNESTATHSSITTRDKDKDDGMPPLEVLEAVLKAYPQAAKHTGTENATPLHWAVRYGYPRSHIELLIRAYPQALDIQDFDSKTPRHYVQHHSPRTRSAVLRPTSCWLQQLLNERMAATVDQEMLQLETEAQKLLDRLHKSQRDEEALEKRVQNIMDELQSFGELSKYSAFCDQATQIHDELEGTMTVIRGQLEGLVGLTKYSDEEKERALLTSFNDDVVRIYNNADVGMEELQQQVERIRRITQKETRS